MMFGLSESFRELTIACKDVVDYLTALPDSGELEDIDFLFGPPSNGRMPFYIIRNGRTYRLGDLCDYFPPFERMRGWMERAMVKSPVGNYYTEILNLDCADSSIMMVLAQSDWCLFPCGNGRKKVGPVSVLVILQSGTDKPMVLCFCRTDRTISNLYRALSDSLTRYRSLFDDPHNWLLYNRRWIGPKNSKTSEYIQKQIESRDLEIFQEFSSIDDIRQKPTIPL